MQHPNFRDSDFKGEEINSGLQSNPGAGPTLRMETDVAVLRQLVTASKDAEGLIACFFELHFVSAVPLEEIWDKLALAIEAAQQVLQERSHHRVSEFNTSDRRIRQRGR